MLLRIDPSRMATETNPAYKPWKGEYAKSSRSSCRACGKPIAKDAFRLAKIQPAHQFDGLMPVSISNTSFSSPDELYSWVTGTSYFHFFDTFKDVDSIAKCSCCVY